MLSLGSNISTTQALDFQYSIDLDGTNDFIDCGPSTSVIANGASEASVMFWIKTTTSENNKYIFSIKRGSSSSAFSCRIINDKIGSIIYNGSGHTTRSSSTSINDGNWHHVAITGKASSHKIYIDGSEEVDENAGFDMETTTDKFTIGDHDGSKFMEMTLSSLAIFNTELDQNNIQAAYNGGGDFNLTLNQGNYNSSSNLTVYYKMGNGFLDDINNPISTSNEQGIIVNQSGTVTIDADQSVAINTTNWETVQTGSTPANLNGQTPVGNGVITFDGTQTGFCGVRPKSAYWNKTVVGEFYRVEVHYTRSAGTVQFKSSGDESTNSGISLSAGSDVLVQQIGIGYIKANHTNWQLTFSSSFVGTVTKVVLQKITPNTSGIVKNGATRSDDTP